MRADTTFVRRVARVGPSLWLFLVVAVVVAALDSSTEAWNADTGASVFHVATYTWNWYLQSQAWSPEPDFGHLWYLSVDMQAFVIMACLCYLLRRHRVGLMFATGGFYLLLVWWRFHVAPTELIFQVLAADDRADGPLRGRRPDRRGTALPGATAALPARRRSDRKRVAAARWSPSSTGATDDLSLPALGRHRAGVGRRRSSSSPSRWGETSALVTAVIGHPAGDLAGAQLPADLHLALPGVRVRRAAHEGRRVVLGGAHRGGVDGDGRDLRR